MQFYSIQEGDVGQVRSILQSGHLAVNKCNFTLFRREMWGRCAPFSNLATLRSIMQFYSYQEGDVGQVRSILQSGHLAVNAADENETTAVQVDTTALFA